MPRYPKPEPVVVETRCSLCDESWDAHGDEPTVLDCIRLLKARSYYVPQPQITPTWPNYPWTTYGSSTTSNAAVTNVVYLTPRDDEGDEPVAV